MFLDWFDTKEAVNFGAVLAENLSTELAKNPIKNSSKDVARSAKALQKTFNQVDQFKQKNKLNFYKKSKLANEFRWKLLELGHSKELANSLAKDLLMHMS